MEIRYEKHWSGWLNRDMEFKIYGSCGKPVIFIPCPAGRFFAVSHKIGDLIALHGGKLTHV